MRFEELIPKIKNGEKVRRNWWMKENYISCHLGDSESFKSNFDDVRVLSAGDVCADDWELYEEEILKLPDNFGQFSPNEEINILNTRMTDLEDWTRKEEEYTHNRIKKLEERIRLLEEK